MTDFCDIYETTFCGDLDFWIFVNRDEVGDIHYAVRNIYTRNSTVIIRRTYKFSVLLIMLFLVTDACFAHAQINNHV